VRCGPEPSAAMPVSLRLVASRRVQSICAPLVQSRARSSRRRLRSASSSSSTTAGSDCETLRTGRSRGPLPRNAPSTSDAPSSHASIFAARLRRVSATKRCGAPLPRGQFGVCAQCLREALSGGLSDARGFAQTLGTLRRENDERRLIGGGGCVRLRILFHDDVSVRTARAE